MAWPESTVDNSSQEQERLPFPLESLHGFVGGNLERAPYLSPFGALVKITRLNRFARRDLFAAFGIRLTSHEDPSKVLAFSAKRLVSFSRSIGVDPRHRRGWNVAEWLPFKGEVIDAKRPWRARVCLPCIREGFHTWLFQMPWTSRCPWHGAVLRDECPSCGRALTRSLYKGIPILQCECGVDFFNRRAALQADPFENKKRNGMLADYLDWASYSRTARSLVTPPHVKEDGTALRELSHSPFSSGGRDPQPLYSHFFWQCRHKSTHASTKKRTLQVLGDQLRERGSSIVEIPVTWNIPMQAIAKRIVGCLPPGCLSTAEAEQLLVGGMLATCSGPSRSDILYLPVQSTGSRSYLITSSLPKPVLVVIDQFLQSTRSCWHAEASASLILRVVRTLIMRGYADGLKIVLGRYVPALYDHPRFKPWVHLPWVAFTSDMCGVSDVHVAWTRENPSQLGSG